jgi:hypothetical protein
MAEVTESSFGSSCQSSRQPRATLSSQAAHFRTVHMIFLLYPTGHLDRTSQNAIRAPSLNSDGQLMFLTILTHWSPLHFNKRINCEEVVGMHSSVHGKYFPVWLMHVKCNVWSPSLFFGRFKRKEVLIQFIIYFVVVNKERNYFQQNIWSEIWNSGCVNLQIYCLFHKILELGHNLLLDDQKYFSTFTDRKFPS